MTGFKKENILNSLEVVINKNINKQNKVVDYENEIVSDKILKIVFSYIDYVNRTVWKKIIKIINEFLFKKIIKSSKREKNNISFF